MAAQNKVLVVEDEPIIRNALKRLLERHDYEVQEAGSVQEAKEHDLRKFDVIISDLAMPEVNGLELLRRTRVKTPQTPFIIFSAYGDTETAVEAMREGAFDFIEKPFKAERLRMVVERALRHTGSQKPNQPAGDQRRGGHPRDHRCRLRYRCAGDHDV